MRRRVFIAGLGSAAAWPVVARAQQPALPVIGYLSGGSANPDFASGFRSGLAETGFVEGRNLAIEFRSADYRYDRLPALVADLISRKVAVIAALGDTAAVAAKAATSAVPIVFFMGEDPVASASSPASTGPAAMSRESPFSARPWWRSVWNSCMS
jgi:putative tryptophan/tyrosine transport system substrate-binding protein